MWTRRQLLQTAVAAQVATRPNIVLILMDDMAQRALSCYGNPLVKTVHIDRLAAEGMRFTQAYVTPQCTPTRATILTGQYTARNKMWHVVPKYTYSRGAVEEPEYRENLSRDTFTLAKGLRAAGYATGCFGKWHLTANADGSYVGLKQAAAGDYGFDVADSCPNAALQEPDKGVTAITDAALAFIEKNRARPFFAYVAHHSIHGPVHAPADLTAKYREKGAPESGLHNATYLAALEHMDRGIGRLLQQLDDWNLTARTAVFFLTDNGGIEDQYGPAEGEQVRLRVRARQFSNTPLRAGKGSSYEGGIRVPLIVRWPGVVRRGAVCETPVHAVDLMPTVFAMAGAKVAAGHVTDGVSVVGLLKGARDVGKRALYWYMPFYDILWAHTPSAVIRDGDWKLIEYFGDFVDTWKDGRYEVGRRIELYNLRDDVGETKDLAPRMPDKAAEMSAKLHAWIASCGAVVPGKNARFDAKRALERDAR